MRLKSLMITACVLLSALVLAPTASAHECETYDEQKCDPNGCTEGEDHKHTHLRHWWEGETESCKSQGKSGGEDDDCYIADKEFPKGVCDLIDDPATICSVQSRSAMAPRDVDFGLPTLDPC